MTEYGGLGGVAGGRPRDLEDAFECAVDRALGDLMRKEWNDAPKQGDVRVMSHDCLAARLWGSLANGSWKHENGDTAEYTFRSAGDLIAAVIGEGDYMDWYCSGLDGVCDPEVATALGKEGWSYDQ